MSEIAASVDETRSRFGDWPLLVGPGVIWGASFFFIAEGLRAVGPNGLTLVRILAGFATLACFPAARRPVPRSAWPAIALLGVVWFALPLTLFPFAEQRVSSVVTGMLNGANPLFTAIVASLLARRLPSRGVAAGLTVGLLGGVLIALPTFQEGQSSTVGVLLILAALVSYGVALNIARPLQQKYGALPVLWRAQAMAMILTAPLGIPEVISAHWSLGPVLALLALGAGGTAIAYALMATAAGRFGATRASSTTFLVPAVALFLGVVVRGERAAWLSVVGGFVCVTGAWLMRRDAVRAVVSQAIARDTVKSGSLNRRPADRK